jgi:tRNA dimethylallyltransferase
MAQFTGLFNAPFHGHRPDAPRNGSAMRLQGFGGLPGIAPDQPVLIAGATASGKSALALAIAEAQGGVIVNADASQVFACWRVVTARPDAAELARAPHALYGHLPFDALYSVGHWLREVAPLLTGPERPIIVGGTGLYFTALTEGLSDIPETPPTIRAEADRMSLGQLLAETNPETLAGLDCANRARVQRAWEVERATGRALHEWQGRRTAPLLPLENAAALVIETTPEWLNPRIAARFDRMLEGGALEEVAAMRARHDPALPAFRAIGVPELMAHLTGETTLAQARDRSIVATRQYAKRQRTWFRARMRDWTPVTPDY